jgi:hypothetical protein
MSHDLQRYSIQIGHWYSAWPWTMDTDILHDEAAGDAPEVLAQDWRVSSPALHFYTCPGVAYIVALSNITLPTSASRIQLFLRYQGFRTRLYLFVIGVWSWVFDFRPHSCMDMEIRICSLLNRERNRCVGCLKNHFEWMFVVSFATLVSVFGVWSWMFYFRVESWKWILELVLFESGVE